MRFKGRILGILLGIAILWGAVGILDVQAQIASDQAFENTTWEMVQEQAVQGANGIVQSICSTEDYIICIENTSDAPEDLDIVYYYYKNDTDENGNPVEQYSLAKTISNRSYEHCNGMAYNPKTKEVVISLYTNNEGAENRGAVYVMDASTFDLKRKVKISEDYNILGIGYREEEDQYVIQTNKDGGYSFKILDADFQIVEDLGQYADTAKGDNFQDLCVSGDYIINFPLTYNMGIGDFIHMYSISDKTMAASTQLNWGFEGVANDEPESICEIAPGEFMAVVNVTLDNSSRNFRLYKTTIPYYFSVTTSVDNGKISSSTNQVLRGEEHAVEFKPDKNYRIESVVVDGENIDVETNGSGYTFSNVQADHTIDVNYVEMTTMERIVAFFQGDKTTETSGAVQVAKAEDTTSTETNAEAESQTAAADTVRGQNQKKVPMAVKIALIIAGVLAGCFAVYLRVVYVRRLRILKRRKADRERRRIKEMYERLDPDELEDIEMREYTVIK